MSLPSDSTLREMLVASGDDYFIPFKTSEGKPGGKALVLHAYRSAEHALEEGRDPVAAIRYAWVGPKGNMSDRAWEEHYRQASRMFSASGLQKGNPMLQVTLKRGRKTKTVRVNPSHSRLKRAGYKRTLAVGGGIGWVDGNRPWIEYARGGRAMKGEPSTVYRKRYFKTIAERDRALFDNPKRRRKNPHSEQVELKLFIDSDGDLYRQTKGPIEKNLTKKFVKGTYNHKLAVKLWKYLADNGAKKYAKDFSLASDWNRMFSVADRTAVAQALADDWLAEMKAGNRHNPCRTRRNPRVSKSVMSAMTSKQMRKALRREHPAMSRGEHAAASVNHNKKAQRCDVLWGRIADKASREVFGRPFGLGDYRVSGVGRDEFSERHKNMLRKIARQGDMHRRYAHVHALLAGVTAMRKVSK